MFLYQFNQFEYRFAHRYTKRLCLIASRYDASIVIT